MKRFLTMAVLLASCTTPATDTTSIPATSPSAPATSPHVPGGQPEAGSTTTEPNEAVDASSSIGDSYYDHLGNAGYDVSHYRVEGTFDGVRLEATAAIRAVALEALNSFTLDLQGPEVEAVSVDGRLAVFEVSDRELRIRPASPIEQGGAFEVEVVYTARPEPIREEATSFSVGWQPSVDGWFAVSEPEGATTWFPANDHPLDKATFELALTVPDPFVVASSGTLIETDRGESTSTYVWQMRQPVATYLVALAIGDFSLVEQESATGVPIRNYVDDDLASSLFRPFERQAPMLDFYVELFGPYPFDEYGAIVLETADFPAALETQTRSTFGTQSLVAGEGVVSHELVHQWFGNSVSVADWSDVWLNEGFATYGQWLWTEHVEGLGAFEEEVEAAYLLMSGSEFVASGVDPQAAARQAAELFPPPGSPDPGDLFNASVYQRGALTLHALRLEVGDESFFRLVRTWAERFTFGNASTDDFLALVEEIGGGAARETVASWLFDVTPPAIPEMGLAPLEG